ncbi:MAG TPA: hypothetical protein VFD70_08985 [Anaerolineae bacterium]|nr:hypothetical protein [Anaerolineae bacterium]
MTSSAFAIRFRLKNFLPAWIVNHARILLAAILLIGLLIRLPFAAIDFHNSADLRLYMDWAKAARTSGLAAIYSVPSLDYPPLFLYFLAGADWLTTNLAETVRQSALIAFIKLPSILADGLTASIIAWVGWQHSARVALLAATLYSLNPAVWYVSAYWGQTDSIYTLSLVLTLVMLVEQHLVTGWLAYTLALGTKVQSLVLAPLLIVATLLEYKWRAWISAVIVTSFAWGLLVTPWLVHGRVADVLQIYRAVPKEAPRVDVSAYNLWYLVRQGHIQYMSSEHHPLGLPVTYQSLGIFLVLGYAALVMVLYIKHRKAFLTAAGLSLGLYMLPTQIHERYMFPVLAFIALAAISDPRLWLVYGLLSATFFFNLVTIAPFSPILGTNLITMDVTSPWIAFLKAVALLAAAINLLVLGWLVLRLARTEPQPELVKP